MLYPILYRIDRVTKRATIIVPDADGLTVEACSYVAACIKAQVEGAEYFQRAKARGEKAIQPRSPEEILKHPSHKGWSVCLIEFDIRSEPAGTDGAAYNSSLQRAVAAGRR